MPKTYEIIDEYDRLAYNSNLEADENKEAIEYGRIDWVKESEVQGLKEQIRLQKIELSKCILVDTAEKLQNEIKELKNKNDELCEDREEENILNERLEKENQELKDIIKESHIAFDEINAKFGSKNTLCIYCGASQYDGKEGIKHMSCCLITRMRKVLNNANP